MSAPAVLNQGRTPAAFSWGGSGSRNYRIPMGGTGYYVDMIINDSGAALPVFSRMQVETFALGRR